MYSKIRFRFWVLCVFGCRLQFDCSVCVCAHTFEFVSECDGACLLFLIIKFFFLSVWRQCIELCMFVVCVYNIWMFGPFYFAPYLSVVCGPNLWTIYIQFLDCSTKFFYVPFGLCQKKIEENWTTIWKKGHHHHFH